MEYAARREAGLKSILRFAEYDCMRARVRALKAARFAFSRAIGERLSLPRTQGRQGDWGNWGALSAQPASEAVWKLMPPCSGEHRAGEALFSPRWLFRA